MSSDDTAVGYKQPPVNRRFPKGKSGNPGGRPKGTGKFSAVMDQILDEPALIRVGRRQVVVTRREALGIEIVNRAVAGDVRMVQLLQRHGFFERADQPMTIWLSEAEGRL